MGHDEEKAQVAKAFTDFQDAKEQLTDWIYDESLTTMRKAKEAHHAYANALRRKPNYEAARRGAAEARAAG